MGIPTKPMPEAGHDDEARDSPADADPVHGYAIV